MLKMQKLKCLSFKISTQNNRTVSVVLPSAYNVSLSHWDVKVSTLEARAVSRPLLCSRSREVLVSVSWEMVSRSLIAVTDS